jgi:hypothetical protein
MSGPEHSLVKYRSGSGFMEIDLHAPNGEFIAPITRYGGRGFCL